MKIYTKTGDTGTTALFGGTRVPKDHIRIESYGTVDELNSHIGLLRDQEMDSHYQEVLIEVQDRLFTVGAILATPPEKAIPIFFSLTVSEMEFLMFSRSFSYISSILFTL